MDGIILVNKPQGWTSFDVCNKIRHLTGTKKVGHSGTLDPMATGVLPVFLGKATKSIQFFLSGDKGYTGEMVLGVRTDTGDATGKTLNPKSETDSTELVEVRNNVKISIEQIQNIFQKYTGEIEQVPPMYSAVKINGQRLYRLARKGIEVKREPRKIKIYELRTTNNDAGFITDNRITFYVLCSKGTYVRQLVMDIGDDLGCGAHLSALERVYSHPFHISQALDIVTIENLAKINKLDTVIFTPEEFITA
jgi:tRNA pseudouridine55 synthase